MSVCDFDEWLYDNGNFFAAVGGTFVVILALCFLWTLVEGIRTFFLSRLFPRDLTKYGKWAVVTGSTDGIGKAYAFQLASRGVNIVLISRNYHKLLSTAEELKRKHNVDVDVIQTDFRRGWDAYDDIYRQLSNKEIGILVNNVGSLEPQPSYFLSMEFQEIVDMVNINAMSGTMMTNMILPQMLERKKGAVVSMPGLTSLMVIPLVSVFGASKLINKFIFTGLYWENKSSGIDFQNLVGSFINTNMISFTNIWKRFGPFVPNADAYCKSAVYTLGIAKQTTGYFCHCFHYGILLLPELWRKYILFWCILRFIKRKPFNAV